METWRGSEQQANAHFESKLEEGADVLYVRETGLPFSGKVVVLRPNGSSKGEMNLIRGRRHGEEIYVDPSGNVHRQLYDNGRLVRE